MIQTKEFKYENLEGKYQAVITDIVEVSNTYYDPSKPNSTEFNLTIAFKVLKDGNWIDKEQRYVSPLIGGKGLFSQLCEVAGITPSATGEVDESALIGMKFIFDFQPNAKGFDNVVGVEAVQEIGTAQGSVAAFQEFVDKPIVDNPPSFD